jgi:plastocyanin
MCAHHEKEGQSGYQNLTGVAWSILVMGLSLTAVIILWVWFGYIGPTFSEDVLANQQRTLRETFGLPVTETIDDPAVLQTPPSLRNANQSQEASTANSNSTTITNDTSQGSAGGAGETAAGGTIITILAGSSVQGNPDYEPEDAEVPLNDNIVWVNKDTVPHTATSGTGAEDANSGKIFDTSIINGGEESTPQQLTGVKEGDEVPYYCQVHPYMTSKLTVGAASASGATAATNSTAGNASSGGGGENATTTTPAPPATTAATTTAAATLTIPQGASVQGNPAYEPDPLTVKVGDTIAVDNKDTTPHTVTNGKDAADPNMGKLFDTSIINAGDSADVVTADLKPGDYPYFCAVHPYMTGSLTVQ